ncbi:MAG: Gfo/Idh/MocA family oxidoreductase [Rhodospirillaceae bacterium]
MPPPWRVGILGLGNIAQGYDTPDGPAINTHIKACLNEPRLTITALSDADAQQAERVARMWGLDASIYASDAFFSAKCDVVCISAPDALHVELTEKALDCGARTVLCEKPLGPDQRAAERLA